MPSTWETPSVRQLYYDEIVRLGRFLLTLGGITPSHPTLSQVMLAHESDRDENSRELTAPGEANSHSTAIPLALLGGPLMAADDALAEVLKRAGGRVMLDATEGSREPVRDASIPFGLQPIRCRSWPTRISTAPLMFFGDPTADCTNGWNANWPLAVSVELSFAGTSGATFGMPNFTG